MPNQRHFTTLEGSVDGVISSTTSVRENSSTVMITSYGGITEVSNTRNGQTYTFIVLEDETIHLSPSNTVNAAMKITPASTARVVCWVN